MVDWSTEEERKQPRAPEVAVALGELARAARGDAARAGRQRRRRGGVELAGAEAAGAQRAAWRGRECARAGRARRGRGRGCESGRREECRRGRGRRCGRGDQRAAGVGALATLTARRGAGRREDVAARGAVERGRDGGEAQARRHAARERHQPLDRAARRRCVARVALDHRSDGRSIEGIEGGPTRDGGDVVGGEERREAVAVGAGAQRGERGARAERGDEGEELRAAVGGLEERACADAEEEGAEEGLEVERACVVVGARRGRGARLRGEGCAGRGGGRFQGAGACLGRVGRPARRDF
jgi:hypothetical protein